MKPSTAIASSLLLLLTGIRACKPDDARASEPTGGGNKRAVDSDSARHWLRIRIGSKTFRATLLNNATASAFKARLPLTVTMHELNGNEKFYRFPTSLPTNASNPGTIQAGDLMLYSSDTLALFYETFSTSYRYTRLGRIDNPSGLAAALGPGNVTVTFELD